jgi:polysaccharide export outer membrane protein
VTAAAHPIAFLVALALALMASGDAPLAQTRDAQRRTLDPQASTPAEQAPRYRLRRGDRLEIRVYGHTDLSGEFVLDGRGTIRFPLIGPVRLGGLTKGEAATRLVDRLKPDYLKQPQVGITILNPRPVYVLGEVEEPGSYPYRTGLTVTEAVALAGGFTFRADPDAIAISRGRAETRGRRRANSGTQVLPGDTVHVDSSLF